MQFRRALLLVLPALSTAYPGLMDASTSKQGEEYLSQRGVLEPTQAEKRQLVNGLLGSLASTITGLLGSVADVVDVNNRRPEPGYKFEAPGPNDSRGPCPGLNLLANYGYLPRDGYVNFGQVLDATSRGFNMGTDLATILTTFAVLTNGNITTQSFYLGSGKDGVGGLNRHSTVEADVSPNREDFYNGCGDNHHLSSRLFKQNVGLAGADPSKKFTLDVMASHYATSADFSKTNNPYLYYFPFPLIVSLGAFAFYPNFFSNGTYGAGGVANYESISAIIGAQYDESSDNFRYVPEKWPENWYRRATPYGAIQALTDAFTVIYPRNIIVPGVAQAGTPNFNARTALCDLYQGINSMTPLLLGGSLEESSKALTWAISKLDPLFKGTALGCPDNVLSPKFLYPNATQVGGPSTLPSASDRNTGNNIYNKVYFATAPKKPQC